MKWYALALIAAGLLVGSRAKWPPGECGLPLYAQIGWLCFAIGVCWLGTLIFLRV